MIERGNTVCKMHKGGRYVLFGKTGRALPHFIINCDRSMTAKTAKPAVDMLFMGKKVRDCVRMRGMAEEVFSSSAHCIHGWI